MKLILHVLAGTLTIGLALAACGATETDTTDPVAEAQREVDEAFEALENEVADDAPEPVLPKPKDFKLDVAVLEKQCFGTAGCNVTFQIDMTYLPGPFPPDADYRVTYQVDGDESGPIIGTIDVTGDQYVTFEEFASTTSTDVELTARVTKVRQ